jgi:hypothetical protein
MSAFDDPVCGRVTESRVGHAVQDPNGEFARWGAKPAKPVCGLRWLQKFRSEPAQLSNGLATERQWCAFHFTACLIKGFCKPDVIADTLPAEGVRPVTVTYLPHIAAFVEEQPQ